MPCCELLYPVGSLPLYVVPSMATEPSSFTSGGLFGRVAKWALRARRQGAPRILVLLSRARAAALPSAEEVASQVRRKRTNWCFERRLPVNLLGSTAALMAQKRLASSSLIALAAVRH